LDLGEGDNLHPHLQLFSIMDSHIMPIQLYGDYRDSIFHSTSGIRDSNPSFIASVTADIWVVLNLFLRGRISISFIPSLVLFHLEGDCDNTFSTFVHCGHIIPIQLYEDHEDFFPYNK